MQAREAGKPFKNRMNKYDGVSHVGARTEPFPQAGEKANWQVDNDDKVNMLVLCVCWQHMC